jgi:hypothetical protein
MNKTDFLLLLWKKQNTFSRLIETFISNFKVSNKVTGNENIMIRFIKILTDFVN